jgi:glycosyltransferase involved in cell wall biosynthesis
VSNPLVSVLIPTYNGARFIRAAVESALAQTHRNIEVIVGDDASTDQTPVVIAEIAATDSRVRIVRHQQNVGAFDNPVRLLEEARGDYVKFLLHDDVLAPTCVADLLAGMRSSRVVTLAFSHRQAIDADGVPVEGNEFVRPRTSAGLIDGATLADHILQYLDNVVGELTTCMFRRSDVDISSLWQVDGRRLAILGDLALFLRLLSRGSAYYDPQTLSSFRVHPGQRSRDVRVTAGGARDWPLLIDWGRRQGFLADPASEVRAQSNALLNAAALNVQLLDSPDAALSLEAVLLSTARLTELRTRVQTDTSLPLPDRAHGPSVLERFGQELQVWSRRFPVALASPTADAAEVNATVAAFRAIAAVRGAAQFVLAVDESLVGEVAALTEAAIAQGPDVDVTLVTATDPATLLTGEWLAVVPPGATWPRGRSCAQWRVELPADARRAARVR